MILHRRWTFDSTNARLSMFLRERLWLFACFLGEHPTCRTHSAPTPGVVDKFFNDSSGTGDQGETDERGPWNEDGFEYVEAPAKPVAEGTATEVIDEIVSATRRGGSRRTQRTPRSARIIR